MLLLSILIKNCNQELLCLKSTTMVSANKSPILIPFGLVRIKYSSIKQIGNPNKKTKIHPQKGISVKNKKLNKEFLRTLCLNVQDLVKSSELTTFKCITFLPRLCPEKKTIF